MPLDVILQALTSSKILKTCMTEDIKKNSECCHSSIEATEVLGHLWEELNLL